MGPKEMKKRLNKKEIRKLLNEWENELPEESLDELEEALGEAGVTAEECVEVVKEYEQEFRRTQIEAGEAVGIIAAQSIGEPGTQMSLSGDELVVVKIGSTSEIVPIGEFIDALIEKFDAFEVEDDLETVVCDIPTYAEIYVPGLGRNEEIKWQKLLQISRHVPNGELLKVTTRSGRTITATFAHSFVIRQDNEIVPIKGRDLRIGDRIPMVVSLPAQNPLKILSLERYLPKTEVWYGSELQIAASEGKGWYTSYSKSYTVPVKKDALRIALKTNNPDMLKPGYVYPKMHHSDHTKIPDELELNTTVGWFIGAYLAEGHSTGTFVSITNKYKEYRNRVIEFAEFLGVKHHTSEKEGEYGPSITTHLLSSLLSKLISRMCGKTSESKFLPTWVLNTDNDFICALLRGYFDGDGNVNVERGMIRASSKSRSLRDGICLLLSRLGIFASKSEKETEYRLTIPARYAPRFRNLISLEIPYKSEALNKLTEIEEEKQEKGSITYDLLDMIPGIGTVFDELQNLLKIPTRLTKKFTKKQRIGRRTCGRYIEIFREKADELNIDVTEQLATLERAYNSDVLWDEIVKLEAIPSPTDYVYDFAVSELETFMTAEGLITHNTLRTFHYAGVAELDVTLGLPRLIEIIDARKDPSTPMMSLYLEGRYRENIAKAKEVVQKLEMTTVERIAKSVELDLINMEIQIELDPELMKEKGLEVEEIEEKVKGLKKGETVVEGWRIQLEPTVETLKDLQKLAERVRGLHVKGIKGVKRALIRKEGEEYVIFTEGTNLADALRVPGVNATRTRTNSIIEIAEVLGIEAARTAMIEEAKGVLEEQGLEVDVRHVMLVADLMTATGQIRQIGRHGVSGAKDSVLARAAFEVTVKHLLEAAASGEEDKLRGVTENVIIGQVIPVGTGLVELLMTPGRGGYGLETRAEES